MSEVWQATDEVLDRPVAIKVLGSSAPSTDGADPTGVIRSEVGKQTGLKHTPSITFKQDTLPDGAKTIDDLVARARQADAELAAARAGAVHAGDPNPYRTPDEADEEDT